MSATPPSPPDGPDERPRESAPAAARRIDCPDADLAPESELVRDARAALREDRVIALPTETVYGLTARAGSRRALDELDRIKGRPAPGALTWHVPSIDALPAEAELPGVARRLAERYWPGPLTLVLRLPAARIADLGLELIARDGAVGLRQPSHRGTLSVLAAVAEPVVMTSANPSGSSPLDGPDAIETAFGGDLALIGDGGPPRLGEASAVLALGRGRFELLREGLTSIEDLRRTAGLRIGFVCTGNTCRSPMAETLARGALARALGTDSIGDFGFDVLSAGVFAGHGAPASAHGVTAMAERGLDLTGHQSRPATPETLTGLDRIYCLTEDHARALEAVLPPKLAHQIELLDPAGRDVLDPVGGTQEHYLACARAIESMVSERLPSWI